MNRISKLSALVISAALVAATSFGSGRETPKAHPSVILVIATNPAFPSPGFIVAPNLEMAEQEAEQMSALDPVCFAVPQVCEDRDAATVYEVFYSDGSLKTF